MNRIFTTIIITCIGLSVWAQSTTVDFEDFGLTTDEFRNGSDGTQAFESGKVRLPINYDDTYSSWTGWALSAVTDNETPGFGNQYSAITGGGVDGSLTYATSYNFVPNRLTIDASLSNTIEELRGLYITNATYTYLSMRDGDAFAKKFGGADGNDPDFFLLTIKGLNLNMEADSVEVYLADYRFEDNTQDFILDEWTFVDLSKFNADQDLTFHLSSSDVGQFGVNTPQYFCIDNILFDFSTSTENDFFSDLTVYPNPASDVLNVTIDLATNYTIVDNQGQLITADKLSNQQVDISALNSGIYAILINTKNGTTTRRFVKK